MEATKRPAATGVRLLKCPRWGVCAAGTADLCGVDITTGPRVQKVAAPRAPAHHDQVTRALQVEGGQRDEMHAQRRGPRLEWRPTALTIGRRCVRWGPWGPRPQERAALLIAQVVTRLEGLPVWLHAGWKASPAALLQVLGRGGQRRRWPRGRHPQPPLVPPKDWCSGQVVQGREGPGTLRRGISRVGYGGPRRVALEMASRGLRPAIPTACRARWWAPARPGRALRRRTRGGSARQRRHPGRVWLGGDLYNVVRPHQRLPQQGRSRTPAMRIGLAEHVWREGDDLRYPVHPAPLGRQLLPQRLPEVLTPALEAG
jgi:hypothetical protein